MDSLADVPETNRQVGVENLVGMLGINMSDGQLPRSITRASSILPRESAFPASLPGSEMLLKSSHVTRLTSMSSCVQTSLMTTWILFAGREEGYARLG